MKFEVTWHLPNLTKFKKTVSPLKVFAFEYTSGGGLTDQELPYSLMHQGEMMHRALLADLSAIPDVKVITTRDSRLPMLDLPQSVLAIPVHGKFAQRFNDCVQAADAVWLVAPEFGGILEGLSRKVLRRKRILLGSIDQRAALAPGRSVRSRQDGLEHGQGCKRLGGLRRDIT